MILGYSRTFGGGGCGSPSSTNLQFWYKSDDITGLSDNDPIGTSSWPNAASGGSFPAYTLRPGTNGAPKYHTTGYNGLPKVTLLQSNTDWLAVNNGSGAPDLSGWSAATSYVVTKNANDPATNGTCGGGDWGFWHVGNPNAAGSRPYTDGIIYESWGTTAFKVVGDPTPSLTNLNYYSVTTASGSYRVHLNASQLFTTSTNTVSFTGGQAPLNFGVSVTVGCQGTFNGDLVEWLVYDTAHDDTARQAVEAYLACRWGI